MIGSDLVLMGKKAGQRDSQRGDPEFLDDGAILQNGQTQTRGRLGRGPFCNYWFCR